MSFIERDIQSFPHCVLMCCFRWVSRGLRCLLSSSCLRLSLSSKSQLSSYKSLPLPPSPHYDIASITRDGDTPAVHTPVLSLLRTKDQTLILTQTSLSAAYTLTVASERNNKELIIPGKPYDCEKPVYVLYMSFVTADLFLSVLSFCWNEHKAIKMTINGNIWVIPLL